MNYQIILKDADTILTEVQALAPSVEGVKASGSSLVFICTGELTTNEIAALASYNDKTLGEIK